MHVKVDEMEITVHKEHNYLYVYTFILLNIHFILTGNEEISFPDDV